MQRRLRLREGATPRLAQPRRGELTYGVPLFKGTPMPSYLVVDIEWHDVEKRKEYTQRIKSVLEKYGGTEVLVGGSEPQVLEGDWKPHRVVILEFPAMAALRDWYGSEEYAPLLRLREQGAKTNMIAVDRPT